jgi:hypothetical protein
MDAMTHAPWMRRMAGLVALIALASASVTSGIALRCEMPRHCAACPVEPGPALVTTGCPMMSPAAPELAASQRAVANDTAVAAVAVALPQPSDPVRPIGVAIEPGASPGSPPGHSVLRL